MCAGAVCRWEPSRRKARCLRAPRACQRPGHAASWPPGRQGLVQHSQPKGASLVSTGWHGFHLMRPPPAPAPHTSRWVRVFANRYHGIGPADRLEQHVMSCLRAAPSALHLQLCPGSAPIAGGCTHDLQQSQDPGLTNARLVQQLHEDSEVPASALELSQDSGLAQREAVDLKLMDSTGGANPNPFDMSQEWTPNSVSIQNRDDSARACEQQPVTQPQTIILLQCRRWQCVIYEAAAARQCLCTKRCMAMHQHAWLFTASMLRDSCCCMLCPQDWL